MSTNFFKPLFYLIYLDLISNGKIKHELGELSNFTRPFITQTPPKKTLKKTYLP